MLAWYHAWPDTCASKPSPGVPTYVAAYVAVWCGPPEQRLTTLAAMLADKRSERGGMRAAIRADLVDLVAASDDAEPPEWLVDHHVDSPDVLAALAATELALGKAAELVRHADTRSTTTCHELGLLAASEPWRPDQWREQLAAARARGPTASEVRADARGDRRAGW